VSFVQRAPRFSLPVALHVRRCNSEWGAARMENISGTGMRFESAQEFLVASLVEIRFLLGLKFVTEVQCRGVVVRQCASDNAKYGIATHFLSYGIGPPGKAVPDQFPIQELHASKHNLS
jgi:hypothetical protein